MDSGSRQSTAWRTGCNAWGQAQAAEQEACAAGLRTEIERLQQVVITNAALMWSSLICVDAVITNTALI